VIASSGSSTVAWWTTWRWADVRRVILAELLHRRGRSLALLLGILVATTAFTVLTGTSESQRLEVRGTVAKAFRGDYDILVRPRASRTALERRTGQVQPNFLSGLFGGITLAQWHEIERIPGIDVAAPLANLGYVLPTAVISLDLSRAATGTHGRVLLRADVRWRSDRGLTRVPDAPHFVYVTPNPLRRRPPQSDPEAYRRYSLGEVVPGRKRPVPVCYSAFDAVAVSLDGPFSDPLRMEFGCFSRATRTGIAGKDLAPLRRGPVRVELSWSFPLLLSAIDPTAEARLTGLDRSVVEGRYLRPTDGTAVGAKRGGRDPVMPILAATHTFVDEQAEIAVRRLPGRSVRRWTQPFGGDDISTLASLRFLDRQRGGPVVQRLRVDAGTAYQHLLGQLRRSSLQSLSQLWRVGPARVPPRPRAPVDAVWRSNGGGSVLDWAGAPASARDTWFRSIASRVAVVTPATPPSQDPPLLVAVGQFDADREGGDAPGTPPLTTLKPPSLAPRGRAGTPALGGRPRRAKRQHGGCLL
jgi:putative ABC transport system permease protein